MSTPVQRSFAGGEISDAIHSRPDTTKYQTGVKTMRNTIVTGEGGSANRPGFEYCGSVPSSNTAVRLIEFEYSDDDTYMLEFGDLCMRVYKNGNRVFHTATNITAATKAATCVVTSAAHGISNGHIVYIASVVGMTELNNKEYVAGGVTANTFQLYDFQGAAINSTAFTTYVSGGTVSRAFQLTTVYTDDNLPDLQYAQSADVMTLTHSVYPPYQLSRMSDTSWAISASSFLSAATRPTGIGTVSIHAGSSYEYYKVTSVNAITGEESYAGTGTLVTITAITKASPAVVTFTPPFLTVESGDEIYITGVVGMTQLNGKAYIAYNVTATTLELYTHAGEHVDSTSFGTFTSGTFGPTTIKFSVTRAPPSITTPIAVLWTAVSGAREYNVYRHERNGFYLVATTSSVSFGDIGLSADTTVSAPIYSEEFSTVSNYPRAVSYIQQSLVLASTSSDPEKLWKSRIGDYKSFTQRRPILADDPTIFTMAGNKVNQIRHIVDLGKMLIFTSSGEWTADGNEGVVTPTAINLKQYSRYGCSKIRPLVIDGNAIFIQARGSIIRDLTFEWESQGYKGNDLTKFARHLFKGHTVVDWAYQQNSDSIVWVVRDDGVLLGLTYVREHQIWGWHRHDTDGLVENVAVVSEGETDSVYITVVRTINGISDRRIERMANRYFSDIKDAKFMDSFATYDGSPDDPAYGIIPTSAGGWTTSDTITLTRYNPGWYPAYFVAGDVGNVMQLYDADGFRLDVTITGYTSGDVVTGTPSVTVPANMRNVMGAEFKRAVDEFSGLEHLEGESISVIADGHVIASPNNPAYTPIIVTNGAVTLDECYGVVHFGLPYVSDLVTLAIDTAADGTLTTQKKLTNQLDIRVNETRGVWTGLELPDDDSVDGMYEYKQRGVEDGEVPPLITDVIETKVAGKWTRAGSVAIRQIDPLPISVLSISPSITIEEGKAT